MYSNRWRTDCTSRRTDTSPCRCNWFRAEFHRSLMATSQPECVCGASSCHRHGRTSWMGFKLLKKFAAISRALISPSAWASPWQKAWTMSKPCWRWTVASQSELLSSEAAWLLGWMSANALCKPESRLWLASMRDPQSPWWQQRHWFAMTSQAVRWCELKGISR